MVFAAWTELDTTAERRKLKAVAPAEDEALSHVASILSTAMVLLYPDAKGKAVYFELFRIIDPVRRDMIRLGEFLQMVRIGLSCPASRLTDLQLISFWRAGDPDSNGVMGMAAFVKIMGKGWDAFVDEQQRQRAKPSWESSSYALLTPPWGDCSPTLAERAAARDDDLVGTWAAMHDSAAAYSARRQSISSEKRPRRRRRKKAAPGDVSGRRSSSDSTYDQMNAV